MKRIFVITAMTLSSFASANTFECKVTLAQAIDKHGHTVELKHTTLAEFETDPDNPKPFEIKESKKLLHFAFCHSRKAGPCVGPRDQLMCALLRIKKPKKARFDAEKYFSEWANEDACRGKLRPVPFALTHLDADRLDFAYLINEKTADSLRCKLK